jgi:hypothetical protein
MRLKTHFNLHAVSFNGKLQDLSVSTNNSLRMTFRDELQIPNFILVL